MPLHVPQVPQQAAQTVQSAFQAHVEQGKLRLPSLRNATGPLELTQPHPIFNLDLADLAAGKGLEAAKPAGWRYLVQQGDNVLASAETALAPTGTEHVFSSFNEGGFVKSTAEAIRTAYALPQVNQGQFELRLLRVPALYVMALWIHDPGKNSDVLVPLEPSPTDLPAGKPVPAAQLLDELRAKAHAVPHLGPGDRTGG
jgi:hypothetical protein